MSERKDVFTLRSIGPMGSDCTGPYAVELQKEATVQEFIDAVVADTTEWGQITVHTEGSHKRPFALFKHGAIDIQNGMKEVLGNTVKHARASGGWTRMDYVLETEPTENGAQCTKAQNDVFTLQESGPTDSYSMRPYAVQLQKEATVKEFIEAVAADTAERGHITVYTEGGDKAPIVDFRYGTVKIPDSLKEILNNTVKRAHARGGPLGMGYVLETEPANAPVLEEIGRQAMNIRMVEAVFKTADSFGEPVDGTERTVVLLYNTEKISAEEVEKTMDDGSYQYDPRIIVTDRTRAANLFPHNKNVPEQTLISGIPAKELNIETVTDEIITENMEALEALS